MKILMLSQGRKVEDQPDFDFALRNAECGGEKVELLNIPFIGYVEKHGGEAFYSEVTRANAEFKPDLIFFQFFHSANPGDPMPCVKAIRESKNRPLVFGSLGDLFETGMLKHLGRPIPSQTLRLAEVADAFFSNTMGDVACELVGNGAKNVVFLPNAFCPCHFPGWDSEQEEDRTHEITMLCSNPKFVTRFPIRVITNKLRRNRLVKSLHGHFGARFSVFGRGWGKDLNAGLVPFNEQVSLYRRSRVVVDAPSPVIKATYYSSDRAFFMLGSGTPLVHFHTPRFEKMLRPDDHAFYVYGKRDVFDACERALRFTDEELSDRRRRIVRFVKERHLVANRMDTMLSVYEALKRCHSGECSSEAALRQIRMHHFLPEIDLEAEYKHAVANWRG